MQYFCHNLVVAKSGNTATDSIMKNIKNYSRLYLSRSKIS